MARSRDNVEETGIAVLTSGPRTWGAQMGGPEFEITPDYILSSKSARNAL